MTYLIELLFFSFHKAEKYNIWDVIYLINPEANIKVDVTLTNKLK